MFLIQFVIMIYKLIMISFSVLKKKNTNRVLSFCARNMFCSCQVTIVGCYFGIRTTKINIQYSIDRS